MGDSDFIVLNLVMVVSTTHVAALMVYVFMLIDVNLAMNTEDIAIKVSFSHLKCYSNIMKLLNAPGLILFAMSYNKLCVTLICFPISRCMRFKHR